MIVALVAALACVITARAEDYLFWFIGDDVESFSYAKMFVGNAVDGEIQNGSYAINTFGDDYLPEYADAIVYDDRPDWDPSRQIAYLGENESDYVSLSFVVEFYNESDEILRRSIVYNLSELTDYIVSPGFDAGWQYTNPFCVDQIQQVPEPTSAIMFLIGGALLSLRRRRRI